MVSGDFNFNVMVETNRCKLVSFMHHTFGLLLVNDPNISTTRQHSCLDLVFVRGVDVFDRFVHVCYFSQHMPMFVCFNQLE